MHSSQWFTACMTGVARSSGQDTSDATAVLSSPLKGLSRCVGKIEVTTDASFSDAFGDTFSRGLAYRETNSSSSPLLREGVPMFPPHTTPIVLVSPKILSLLLSNITPVQLSRWQR